MTKIRKYWYLVAFAYNLKEDNKSKWKCIFCKNLCFYLLCVEVKTAVKAMPVTDVLCRGFETEQGFKKSKKKL